MTTVWCLLKRCINIESNSVKVQQSRTESKEIHSICNCNGHFSIIIIIIIIIFSIITEVKVMTNQNKTEFYGVSINTEWQIK